MWLLRFSLSEAVEKSVRYSIRAMFVAINGFESPLDFVIRRGWRLRFAIESSHWLLSSRIKSDSSLTIGMIVGRVAINGSKSPLDIRIGMTSPLAIESGHWMFSSCMNYRPPALYNQKNGYRLLIAWKLELSEWWSKSTVAPLQFKLKKRLNENRTATVQRCNGKIGN